MSTPSQQDQRPSPGARRYGAVLLGLDGTLVDTAPGILDAYRATLRVMGHEPDPALDLTHVIGPALSEVMPPILARYGDDRVEEAMTMYRHFYGEGMLYRAQVYEGIRNLVLALHAAGCRLFVATAKRLDFADRLLDHFNLLPCFEAVHGSVSSGALDQKADLVAHVLAENGIDPADAVLVGDRRDDLRAAAANGMEALGVLWGYGEEAELRDAGATNLVRTPLELEALLLGSHARPAVAADLPGILELYRSFASYDPSFGPAQAAAPWQQILAQPGMTVVVAEAEGQVIASCVLVVIPNLSERGRPWALIEHVVIHPEHRHRRLGRRVLAYAKARAWEAGCFKVVLTTGSRQEETVAAFERAGFRRTTKTHLEARRPHG